MKQRGWRVLVLAVAGVAAVPGGRWLGGAVTRLPQAIAPPRASGGRLVRADLPLRQACRAVGTAYPPARPWVHVRKSQRVLTLYSGNTAIKEYRVGLGADPGPDKEREGDSRTPTGEFYICTRLEQSRFHRFLGISYPAPEDARQGLKRRWINNAQCRAILNAHRSRRQPPWNTALGGAVGIHGGGAEADWTLGCVALENEGITELFGVLPLGTRVRIE